MILKNPMRFSRRRRIIPCLWILFALLLVDVEGLGLSRNPLFAGVMSNYRRYVRPSAYAVNHLQPQPVSSSMAQPVQAQQQHLDAAASNISPAVSTNSNADPYATGSNSVTVESKVVTDGAADLSASVASASNLLAAPSYSSGSYSSGGGGSYGGGGGSGGGYGGSGGGAGGYGGGGAGGYGGGGAGGYGGGGAGGYGGGGAGGYGGGGLGGGGYGGGGAGGYGGAGGLGGGGGYHGPEESSYSISYPSTMSNNKADTVHLLSSLAPSLLLSSLLLPLALALLSNFTGTIGTGRKKRDLYGDEDYDEDVQFSLKLDELDAEIKANDFHFFSTSDALIDFYSLNEGEPEKLMDFVRERGLTDPLNPCLEKIACLSATNAKFKGSDKLKKATKSLRKASNLALGTRERMKVGSDVGSTNERECLTKFICQSMKMLKSS